MKSTLCNTYNNIKNTKPMKLYKYLQPTHGNKNLQTITTVKPTPKRNGRQRPITS